MAIVADFESYPQWNDEVKAVCVLGRRRSTKVRIKPGTVQLQI
jgi:hypothetical protein